MNQLALIQKPVCKWHLSKNFRKEKISYYGDHNPELAHEYADRIIEFSDGQIRHDSRPHIEHEKRTFRIETHQNEIHDCVCVCLLIISALKGRTF